MKGPLFQSLVSGLSVVSICFIVKRFKTYDIKHTRHKSQDTRHVYEYEYEDEHEYWTHLKISMLVGVLGSRGSAVVMKLPSRWESMLSCSGVYRVYIGCIWGV